jgi:ribosome-associated protein
MSSLIKITENLSIPVSALMFTACRSSGPGGQNVNKVNTRVTLWFDVVDSPSLSTRQKEMIRNHLPTRINKEGVLRVVSQKYRSQAQNRNTTIERFVSLLHEALKEELPRKKMTVSYAARQRRLEEKKHRSLIKHDRSKRISLDD